MSHRKIRKKRYLFIKTFDNLSGNVLNVMDFYFMDLDIFMDQIIFPKYKTYIKKTVVCSV